MNDPPEYKHIACPYITDADVAAHHRIREADFRNRIMRAELYPPSAPPAEFEPPPPCNPAFK